MMNPKLTIDPTINAGAIMQAVLLICGFATLAWTGSSYISTVRNTAEAAAKQIDKADGISAVLRTTVEDNRTRVVVLESTVKDLKKLFEVQQTVNLNITDKLSAIQIDLATIKGQLNDDERPRRFLAPVTPTNP